MSWLVSRSYLVHRMVYRDVAPWNCHLVSCDWVMKVVWCKFEFFYLLRTSDRMSILRRMWATATLVRTRIFLQESTVGSHRFIQKPSNIFLLIPQRRQCQHVARKTELMKWRAWRRFLDWQVRWWYSNWAVRPTTNAPLRGVHCKSP